MMGAIQDILTRFGNETVTIIQQNLSETGTNASGRTSRSLQSVATEGRVTVSGKAFIYVVETGRKPGKMPPVGAIMQWLQDKPVSFLGTIESAAWAISKTIAKSGSSLFRSGGRDDIITPAISDERIDKLTKELADVNFKKVLNVIDANTSNDNS